MARLRRAAGGRRHPLRSDHRRLRRGGTARSTGSVSPKALRGSVAAVSVGIVDGEALLDLDYEEDSRADTDMNVVMTGDESVSARCKPQPSVKRSPRELLERLLDLAAGGIADLSVAQLEAAEAPSL